MKIRQRGVKQKRKYNFKSQGPQHLRIPSIFWAPKCQDVSLSVATNSILVTWTKNPCNSLPKLCNQPPPLWSSVELELRGPCDSLLSNSSPVFLLLDEEFPVMALLSSQAFAISPVTNYRVWALPSSERRGREKGWPDSGNMAFLLN